MHKIVYIIFSIFEYSRRHMAHAYIFLYISNYTYIYIVYIFLYRLNYIYIFHILNYIFYIIFDIFQQYIEYITAVANWPTLFPDFCFLYHCFSTWLQPWPTGRPSSPTSVAASGSPPSTWTASAAGTRRWDRISIFIYLYILNFFYLYTYLTFIF